jgi:hypothetical protein
MTTTTPITEQTPPEIDEQLAELHGKVQQRRAWQAADSKPRMPWRAESERELAERTARLEEHAAKLAELREQMAPLNAEFDRRGGWERAFFCTAHGGHVHRTMDCSTCRWDTSFTWQTWLSGKSEAEIIAEIAMTACTVCYPTAPVAQMTTEQRKAHSRAEVEARKAARGAAKLEKELAKVPRAHSLALKVDELVDAFGLDVTATINGTDAWRAAYDATVVGRFSKGYDNAFHVWADVAKKATRRSVMAAL